MLVYLLALLIQQVEKASWFLADEVDTAHVVNVVDVVPGDSLWLVLLLWKARKNIDKSGESEMQQQFLCNS